MKSYRARTCSALHGSFSVAKSRSIIDIVIARLIYDAQEPVALCFGIPKAIAVACS